MNYSPSTLFLKSVKDRLEPLKIPIYFYLPNSDVPEPFIVIGSNTSDTSRTAQTGSIIDDFGLNIDAFLPATSRTEAEEVKSKMIRALGRNQRINAQILMDDSIGREVYHISINITETIM